MCVYQIHPVAKTVGLKMVDRCRRFHRSASRDAFTLGLGGACFGAAGNPQSGHEEQNMDHKYDPDLFRIRLLCYKACIGRFVNAT